MTELSPDVGYNAALWLVLAVSLGAAVGLERRLRGHPAGLHTNSLVALGSAATVWCASAVGVLSGIGRPWLACLLAAMVLMVNVVLHYVEHSILKQEQISHGGN